MVKLVNTCSKAKEVWEILKMVHEGASKAHMSRLKLRTTTSENLRMNEETSENMMAYTCKWIVESESSDENLTEEEIVEIYRLLITK